MSHQYRTHLEHRTTVTPADVLQRARTFFSRHNSIYATYEEKAGPAFVTFRGQGNEEIVIAATTEGDHTLVTGSSYLFDMQVARFFTTLEPAVSA